MSVTFDILQAANRGMKTKDIPYQDYRLVCETDSLLIVAMADGLGSASHSDSGSRFACEETVRYFMRHFEDEQSSSEICRALASAWAARVKKLSSCMHDFSTTLSLLVVDKHRKHVLLGQLGDTMVAYRKDGDRATFVHVSDKEFINETCCLGNRFKNSDFKFVDLYFDDTFDFMIATDGFADEIVSEQLDRLFDYFKKKYGPMARKHRNYTLKKEIQEIMSTKNSDDKTLVFGWRNLR